MQSPKTNKKINERGSEPRQYLRGRTRTCVSGERHLRAVSGRVRRTRLAMGWRMLDLSQFSGVSLPQVWRLEQGLCFPRLNTIQRLAKALKIKPKDLLRGGQSL